MSHSGVCMLVLRYLSHQSRRSGLPHGAVLKSSTVETLNRRRRHTASAAMPVSLVWSMRERRGDVLVSRPVVLRGWQSACRCRLNAVRLRRRRRSWDLLVLRIRCGNGYRLAAMPVSLVWSMPQRRVRTYWSYWRPEWCCEGGRALVGAV